MSGFGTAGWLWRKVAELAATGTFLAIWLWVMEQLPLPWIALVLGTVFLLSAVAVGVGLLASVAEWLRAIIRGP